MARINRIVRNNPISTFRQVAPSGGIGFQVLAGVMNATYERVAPAAIDEMEQRGKEFGRDQARRDMGNPSQARVSSRNGATDTFSLIREFEGFRDTPYWDVNAHRAGYGSDTITSKDGSVRQVTEGDSVSREDAERDLQRRVSDEFEPAARNAIGAEKFDSMTAGQKAAVTSISYNYGEIPERIVDALRNGTTEEAAAAIRGLGSDNDGVNEGRRNREADIFLGGQTRLSTRNDPDAEPEGVAIRNSDGKLEMRKYSPYAGPILRAHDAAAKVAYLGEVLNKGQIDLMEMSQQFTSDPEGFVEAAQGYIDTLIENAPQEVAGDLRDILTQESHRRRLGLLDERHRETRARANNSSRALMIRWSTEYSEAVLSGDPYEVAQSQDRLDSILQAREALPGVNWTEEQSANVFIKAQENADRLFAQQRKVQNAEFKDGFQLITEAAKVGANAANEDLLQNPEAVAAHPELAAEARAFVTLRDGMPEFLKMTPDEQAAAVARLADVPVSEGFELDLVEAARKVAKENREAWDEDPVKRASEVLETPPPNLPDLTDLMTDDPKPLVDAIKARVKYMNDRLADGYFTEPDFLSEDEAKGLEIVMGLGSPPEARAALASVVAAGAGPDAYRVLDEMGGDKATLHAGQSMVAGNPAVAAEIFRGQTLLAEKQVQLPPKSGKFSGYGDELGAALAGGQIPQNRTQQVIAGAQAIFAARAAGVEMTSESADVLLQASMQASLGQTTNRKGDLRGGVQPVMGHQTLLPTHLNGDVVDEALRFSLGGDAQDPISVVNRTLWFFSGGAVVDAITGDTSPDFSGAWEKAGGIPTFNGKPIPKATLNAGQVQITPTPDGRYRMDIVSGNFRTEIYDQNDNVLMFNLSVLMEAME